MATSKESNENVGEIKVGHFVHSAITPPEKVTQQLEQRSPRNSSGLLFIAINTTGSLQCLFAERKYCDYSKI